MEPSRALADQTLREVRGDHQFRSRLHRFIRDSGQLLRLSDLGHLESRVGRRSRQVTTAQPPRATSPSTGICCSSRVRGLSGRIDCGGGGVEDTVSKERLRGHPHLRHHRHRAPEVRRERADVPRLAHAHCRSSIRRIPTTSTSTSPGSSRVRSVERAARDASTRESDEDPNTALFRIEVIKVPLAHPEQAAIVSSPRIFNDLERRRGHGRGLAENAASPTALAPGRIHRVRIRRGGGDPDADQAVLDSIVAARMAPAPRPARTVRRCARIRRSSRQESPRRPT